MLFRKLIIYLRLLAKMTTTWCMLLFCDKTLKKYFVSIICGNYVHSMETLWRVIPFMNILL